MKEPPIEQVRRTHEATRPVLIGLLLTVVGCAAAYLLLGAPPLLGAEDAAIGFRYARNLADGHGIVFNPGGERVEGFTSVSWLLISAVVYRLFGAASLEPVLLLLSLGMTVATIAVTVRMLLDSGVRREAVALGLVWILSQAGFFYWSGLSLMDVAPWALGLALFALVAEERLGRGETPGWAGAPAVAALVVLLVLTRPESMLVVPGGLVVAALVYGTGAAFRSLAIQAGGTVVAAVGLLTVFRVAYFGVPLPNTYYTKVSPDVLWRLRSGAVYVLEYLSAHPIGWVLALSVLALPVAYMMRRRAGADVMADGVPRIAVFLSGFLVVGVASIVWGGGDHYQGHRFLQSWLIPGAIPLAAGAELAARRLDRASAGAGRLGAAVLVGIFVLALVPQWTTYRDHGLRRQAIDVGMQGRFVGATMTAAFDEPRPELGLWMVGGASYTYLGPVKDLLGLNWTAMGRSPGDRKGPRDHAAFNVDVFWSDPPELMVPEPEVVLGASRCVRSVLGGAFQGLLVSERFAESFEPVRVQRDDGEPMIAYARTDWLRTAPPSVEPLGWSWCGRTPQP